MKSYTLNYTSQTTPFEHYWEHCVGSGHAALALQAEYRAQLEKISRDCGFQYVRFHGLFDDDMSVCASARGMGGWLGSGEGEYTLSFTNIDSIFDFLLSIGMRPFVELGFMPKALTSGDCTIFHYEGHTSPPDDYEKWRWLVEQFTRHCVERYGLAEVRHWFFEVWNEPNLGGRGAKMGFWGGDIEDYFQLYKYAALGVKAVDSRLKVGGPATADNSWVPELISFCAKEELPLDFVTTHNYPTDIQAGCRHGSFQFKVPSPEEMEAAKQDNVENRSSMEQALNVEENMWKDIPRGILTDWAKEIREEAGNLPVYYTEWNSGAERDSPFSASFAAKTCLDNIGIVQGYSWWTFTDIFEEGGMPHVPFHGGFGLQTLHGIPKATYRAFQLIHKLGGQLYAQKYNEGTVDIYAIKKEEAAALQLLVINHQSLSQPIQAEDIQIRIDGLPCFAEATVERVDETHGNALARWKQLGEPDYLDEGAIHDLMAASYVRSAPLHGHYINGSLSLNVNIPAQGIALITICC